MRNPGLPLVLLAAGAVAVVLSLAPLRAQVGAPNNAPVALGYCQLTSIDTAVLLSTCSGGIPAGATQAVVKAEAQAVRWRDDGVAPSATVGMPMATADAPLQYNGAGGLAKFQVISQTSGAKLDVVFYRLQQ